MKIFYFSISCGKRVSERIRPGELNLEKLVTLGYRFFQAERLKSQTSFEWDVFGVGYPRKRVSWEINRFTRSELRTPFGCEQE